MKYLLLTITMVISMQTYAQNVVSVTLLGTKTKAQLLAQYQIPFIQFGVNYYRVKYETPDVHGVKDTASGLLVVPDNLNKVYPRLVYQHGTVSSKTDVPSINVTTGGEGQLGFLFGGLGYVALLPDFLGLGSARGFHPYVHAASEASASEDMLRAVATWSSTHQVVTNDQLFITGYSQGGHAAMALHRNIEKNLSAEFNVTAAAPMSGPYSIGEVMRGVILNDAIYFYPAYIPNTVLGYETAYGNIYNELSDVFKPIYVPKIQQYYNGQITLTALNTSLISLLVQNEGSSRPFRMIQDSIIQAITNDPNHSMNVALKDNNTYTNWTPQAPTRLFYCTADDQVPYTNSLLAKDSLLAQNAVDLQIQDVLTTGNHGQCVTPALTATILFFASLQQVGSVNANEADEALSFSMAPNPVTDALFIQDLATECQVNIFSLNGALQYTKLLAPGSHRIETADFAKGIHYLQVQSGTRSRVLKFLVH